MRTNTKILFQIDWLLVVLYGLLVTFGWLNIHAASYGKNLEQSAFDIAHPAGKQLLWSGIVALLCGMALLLETRFYQTFAYVIYLLSTLLLLATLLWGIGTGGHNAWLRWGMGQLQPSEFAKLGSALAVARYLDAPETVFVKKENLLKVFSFVLLPMLLILLQGDMGSSLVFTAFVLVFYREGFPVLFILIGLAMITIFVGTLLIPQTYLIIGIVGLALIVIGVGEKTWRQATLVSTLTTLTIILIEGVQFFIQNILKPHQQNRLLALVDPNTDPLGIGWNVTQAKIAIGSGGFWGKGFLQGTQTKYGFVPTQTTDFIFCTIGEEHGWLGALCVIGLFIGLLSRMLYVAERQKIPFARIYGYAVLSILLFHFTINIGMTIGLMPVIGIPLPFISYGGSALCAFSLMLFILLRFDAERKNQLDKK